MAKYRKKPVVIEAVQLIYNNWSEMCDFAGVGRLEDGKPQGVAGLPDNAIGMDIPIHEGVRRAEENDWIIRDVAGKLYPCKPDIFEATYELVE